MSLGDRIRWVLSGIGQTLITAGLVILLFCVYELSFTGLYTERQQEALGNELESSWQAPAPAVPTKRLPAFKIGDGVARIYFPTLGKDERHVIVEGVTQDVLKRGPGHYPGTALPGELGNVVVSGHRTTYGAPFSRLGELGNGDPVVIETKGFFYTYRINRTFIVRPDALGETDPVPNKGGAKPTKRLLTLTTCHPKFSARSRLILRAELEAPLAKGPGVVPPALASVAT